MRTTCIRSHVVLRRGREAVSDRVPAEFEPLYRRSDVPQPRPWALHPFAQFPANFAASTLARHSRRADDALDRYQRWRLERWWQHEMGDRQSHFQAVETFRR
jgi:hypothetical protein